MNNSQKACLFCGHIMHPSRSKGRGKSEEHIIPQWLMDHLGIRDMPITSLRHDVPSGTITNKRWHPVGNFVAGKVCADCNNGWMSDLEVQAKPILIRLIADPHQLSYLPEHERHTVARWTLKTAGVLNRASTSGNSTDPFARPVHDEHLRKVQSGSIPGDVIVVGSGCPSNTISDALQNASWAVPNNCVPLLPSDRERSYKIGLSFRSLLLAVAYYPNPEYHYGITEGSYAVLWDGTERIIRTNDGVGEVPILADSPILEGFLGNIFVVSKTWWTIRENTVATRFVVVPQR
jgi:hypothetical protein